MSKTRKSAADSELLESADPTAQEHAEAPQKRRFVVTFNPPSPVGDRARRMEVDADSKEDAEAIWRRETGFLGVLGAPLEIVELSE